MKQRVTVNGTVLATKGGHYTTVPQPRVWAMPLDPHQPIKGWPVDMLAGPIVAILWL